MSLEDYAGEDRRALIDRVQPTSLRQAIDQGDERVIISVLRRGGPVSHDTLLEIYQLAKKLKSNRLLNAVRAVKSSSLGESRSRKLIDCELGSSALDELRQPAFKKAVRELKIDREGKLEDKSDDDTIWTTLTGRPRSLRRPARRSPLSRRR